MISSVDMFSVELSQSLILKQLQSLRQHHILMWLRESFIVVNIEPAASACFRQHYDDHSLWSIFTKHQSQPACL